MKKKLLLVVSSLVVMLSSCVFGNLSPNDSSSSTTTSVPTSSSTSTTTPTSTSSTDPIPPVEPFDVTTIFGQVGYSLSKYNSLVDIEYMEANSNLKGKTTVYQKDLLNICHLALDEKMPEVKGARRYQGDFDTSVASRTLTTQERQDLNFFKNYGLISGTYYPDKAMKLDDVRIFLGRIHQYFGTSEKDDFASTIMRDFLYEKDPLDGCTQDDYVRDSTVVSQTNMYKNAHGLLEDAIKDLQYSSLDEVYKVYDGRVKFNLIDDDSSFKQDLLYIKNNLTSYSSIQTVESHFMYDGYQCSFFHDPNLGIGYDDELEKYYFAYLISSDAFDTASNLCRSYNSSDNSFDIDAFWSNYTDDIQTAYYQMSFLIDLSFNELTSSYRSFLEKLSDILKESGVSAQNLYVSASLSTDPLNYITESNNANYPYPSYLTDNGIGVTNGAFTQPSFLFACLLGRFMELAKTDSSLIPLYRAYAYLSCYQRYQAGIEMIFNNEYRISEASLFNLIGYPLTAYFQTTPEYSYDKNKVREIFDRLIFSLKANATTNGWLSNDGINALKEKADLVTASLFGSYEGEDYDFDTYYGHNVYTSDITYDYKLVRKGYVQMLSDWASHNVNLAHAACIFMEPFTANAFYYSLSNSITITMGYLSSIGFDLRDFSDEELMATFGLVVGHEITHGFDSNGCYYDGHGNEVYNSIFPAADLNTYQQKQQDVIKLYTTEIMPGITQSGSITLSEDLADLGGMSLVHRIIKDNYSNFSYREFYTQVARHFLSKASRAYYKSYLSNDVHAYGIGRTNTLLKNCPIFMSTFGIKEGDGMYRDPSEQIVIW